MFVLQALFLRPHQEQQFACPFLLLLVSLSLPFNANQNLHFYFKTDTVVGSCRCSWSVLPHEAMLMSLIWPAAGDHVDIYGPVADNFILQIIMSTDS